VFNAALYGKTACEVKPGLAKGIYQCKVTQLGKVVLQTKLVVQ
jgi:hypothetical protein